MVGSGMQHDLDSGQAVPMLSLAEVAPQTTRYGAL